MDNPDTPCETVLSDGFCLIICTLSAKKRLRIWTVLPTMSLTTVPKTANTRVLNLSSCSFATFRYTRVCLTGRLSSARAGFLFMWVRPTLPRGFQTGTLRSEGRARGKRRAKRAALGLGKCAERSACRNAALW